MHGHHARRAMGQGGAIGAINTTFLMGFDNLTDSVSEQDGVLVNGGYLSAGALRGVTEGLPAMQFADTQIMVTQEMSDFHTFTVEFSIYYTAGAIAKTILDNAHFFARLYNSSLHFGFYDINGSRTDGWNLYIYNLPYYSTNHIAMTYSPDKVLRLFLNGNLFDAVLSSTGLGIRPGGVSLIQDFIDSPRFTLHWTRVSNIVRYTSNFTPPTSIPELD